MGNDTSIDLRGIMNPSNNSNSTGESKNNPLEGGIPGMPIYRPRQDINNVNIQAWAASGLLLLIVITNIIMIVVFNVRFLRSTPHIILNNVLVVDLLSGLLPGLVWTVGVALNNFPWQAVIRPLCEVQGFLNNSLFSVFLFTIYLLSMSQLLAVMAPRIHSQLFKNQLIPRMLLLGVWLFSFLIAAFPIIAGWGFYGAYDANCWMAWKTGNDVIMSFNIFTIVLTLAPAVVMTLAAVGVVATKPKDPNSDTITTHGDILLIGAIQLFISTAFRLALSILNAYYYQTDYKGVDFKTILSLFFFYYARGLWNPLVCLAVSKDIRSAFVDVIICCRCKCGQSRVVPVDVK